MAGIFVKETPTTACCYKWTVGGNIADDLVEGHIFCHTVLFVDLGESSFYILVFDTAAHSVMHIRLQSLDHSLAINYFGTAKCVVHCIFIGQSTLSPSFLFDQ